MNSSPMPFELRRTLLLQGMIERRNKRKSAPPRVPHAAPAIFDDLGTH
jgi:hypothetical protein